MRIAIIGTGIAGNTAAYLLRDRHEITVFEAAGYVGGHTNTIDVEEADGSIPVDTGFIVFNERTYPHFIGLLDDIGQRSKPSNMSFSVHEANDAFEYCGTNLNGLFAKRSSVLRPSFHRMLRDIVRFYREAADDIRAASPSVTVGKYLAEKNYSRAFADRYLVPMVAAIWSADPDAVLDMPAVFLVRFFDNHGLLQFRDRPQWRVIEGGSRAYVEKLVADHRDRIRLNCPATSVRRMPHGVEIESPRGKETFDAVFVACHSDQALGILADPTTPEREVLGAIGYQANEAILHTDTRVLPRRRRAWSAWNYHVPASPSDSVSVSYNMNILQGLDTRETYCVTLNDDSRIAEEKIIRRIQYDHPMYTLETIAAQERQAEINCARTFYCGAYWRNGFHEDGVVSAIDAVAHFEERLGNAELHLRRAG